MFLTKSFIIAATVLAQTALGFVSYADEFVSPSLLLLPNDKFDGNLSLARASVVDWADAFAAQGPWSVTNKPFASPTGNKHDYLSWSPYSWPNCDKAGNTTVLTDQQIWTTCPYETRDGQFNPDVRLVNDTGAFQAMSDAVFFNAMAWRISGSASYASQAVSFINTWFINPDTAMTPNLNYAQVQRGPGVQVGQHTGVLDLKCMAKLSSAILTLRGGKSDAYTADIDTKLVAWITEYIHWLETSSLALGEKAATNNHGSFYYTQLAALKLIANDQAGAKQVVQSYFSSIYLNQISANGDQPLESARTRPYHYRAYNLAAMITTSKIGAEVGLDTWNIKTKEGGNIQSACDYAMTISATTSNEADYAAELYPAVAAVAAHYGDPTGKYAKFLAKADATYPEQPYFFWYQPLSDSGLVAELNKTATTTSGAATGGTSATPKKESGALSTINVAFSLAGLALGSVSILSLF